MMGMNQDQGVEIISKAFVKLWKENQVMKEKLGKLEFENLSSEVFHRIDGWLSRPYEETSEREDIERFAREITRFIVSEVKK